MKINYVLNSLTPNNESQLMEVVNDCLQKIIHIDEGNKILDKNTIIDFYEHIHNKNNEIKQKFFNLFTYKLLDSILDENFLNTSNEQLKELESNLCLIYHPLNNVNNSISLRTQQTHLALATQLYVKTNTHVNVINFLIEKGAKPVYEGSNALIYATKDNCEELVDKYLTLGANPTVSRGEILGYALSNGSFNILEKFRVHQKKESIEQLVFENKDNILYFMVRNYFLKPNHNLETEKNEKILFNTILYSTKNVTLFNMQKEKYILENSLNINKTNARKIKI